MNVSNPLQRARAKNLDFVKTLIGEKPKDQIDIEILKRVLVLRLGCTRKKAEEYIEDVLG